MKKYDCNKTLDYSHELGRICRSCDCAECLVGHLPCSVDRVTQEHIDIVQKWSDEHPEAPKLTKKERAFLECFKCDESCHSFRKIRRVDNGVRLFNGEFQAILTEGLFSFLKIGESMTFEELLELEVEDD